MSKETEKFVENTYNNLLGVKKQTILEQFKTIEDAVADLKKMMNDTHIDPVFDKDTELGKKNPDWFKSQSGSSRGNTPENTDGEGGFINPNI